MARNHIAPEMTPAPPIDDDDMDAMYDAAVAAGTIVRIPVGRDRFGRFTRRVDINAVDVWVNDVDGMSHAPTCGDLRGTRHRAGVAVESTGRRTGWACDRCTWTDTRNPWIESRDIAPVIGSAHCPTCDRTRPIRSFPTIVLCGVRNRAVACRECETAARRAGTPFDNYAMTYARDVYDADAHPITAAVPARGPLHGPVMPRGLAA